MSEHINCSIEDVNYEDLFYYPEIEGTVKREVALGQKVMARLQDANTSGHVFGGWIFSQMDMAGAAVAQKKTGGLVATVGVTDFRFIDKVKAGEILSIYCECQKVGKTSLQYKCTAWGEDCKTHLERRKVASGVFSFVAIDVDGRLREY